jgi:cysteine-rich repeat protein
VDPDTDGANDSQNSPPISFNDANISVVIAGRCGNGTVDPGEDCEPGSTGESGDCDRDCTSAVCGDRVRNRTAGEQCDNGATCSDGTPCTFRRNCRGIGDEECSQRDGDGCSNTCQLELAGAVCGNGRLEGDEACDDGNTISEDGCSAACIVELGYDCAAAQPSVCTPICGDGISVGDELCDGSVTNRECCSSTCAFQYSGAPCGDSTNNACNRPDTCNGAGTCRANFAINGTACDDASAETKNDQCLDGVCTGAGPDCGNGAVGGGEECDDGNGLNGDGCSGLCRAEAGYNCTGHPSVCVLMSRKPGDANCDGQRGAADLVQFVILIARGDRAPCRQDDLTGDRRVAADDLTAYIPLIFGAP